MSGYMRTSGCWNMLHIGAEVCCHYVFERLIYLVFHSLANTYWATLMCQMLCEEQKIDNPERL